MSEVDAGISFSLPWGNPRKYSAGVTEARANLAAAQAALERTETEAIGSLRDALQKVTTAHHHVELFRDKLVPQMRQAFQATQLAYESGKATFAEWIAVQRNLRDMEAEARMHLTDHQMALAELESVVGADLNIFPVEQLTTKSKMKTTIHLLAVVAFALVAACSKTSAPSKPPDVDYYTCTMHPSVHAEVPGKCPICGMELVPVMKRATESGKDKPSSVAERKQHG